MESQLEIDEDLLKSLCTLLHLEPNRIKLDETFIHNGGDSLLAIKFSNLIQTSQHVRVGAGPILRAEHLGSLLDKTQIEKLASGPAVQSPQNNGILPPVASTQENLDDKTLDPIQRFPKVIPSTGLPITFIQAGAAHYTHHVPGAAVQHVTQYCFTDALPKLKEAFAKAMSLHQTFRLKFLVETSPLQIRTSLKDSFQLDWTEQQVESLEKTDFDKLSSAWSIEASHEPVFRVVTPNDGKLSVVHWFFHLSLMDGRSMDILMRQVDSFMNDPSSSPNANDCTFDVVKGLADYHAQQEAVAQGFWATHEVPASSRNHPLLQALGTRTPSRVRMTAIEVFYPEDVKVFQSRSGFTFEVLVRAAMALVLSKLQGTANVSLMSVNSRRSLPVKGIEDVVGSFASSMPLTIDVDEDDSAHVFLKQVFHKVLELDDVAYSDPSDGFSIGGLVVVSTDLQPHAPWYSGGCESSVMSPKETLTTLYVGSSGKTRFCFNREWRTREEMQIMTDLFKSALISLGSGTLGIGDCLRNMLPIRQRIDVLGWGNCFTTKTTLERVDDDITSLFTKQAQQRGCEVALEFSGQQVTYHSLANKVLIIGHRLRELLKPQSVVLLHADGSINWIVGMFAVLWADCIFAPQGEKLPHQLRSRHYAISQAQAFLVPQENAAVSTPDNCNLSLCIETILKEEQQSNHDESTTRHPNPLSGAYICFSSGTTGQPKAIRCHHAGVVSLLTNDLVSRLHVVPGHRVAQTLAPSFDGGLLEVFSALCFGGTLVLKNPLEPLEHLRIVDSFLVTPSLAAELNPEDYINHVKNIYIASEILPQTIADKWSAGQAIVHNAYGPTECHMINTAQKVKPGKPVTIGKALPSARIYILDSQRQLVSPLIAGEIYISGVQVSHGYIGLPEENKLRFVPDSIWPSGGGRMYRTGDWGYWTLDGEIAFIGRTDRQVKLGGFRVDLNDVQARLQNAIPLKVRVAAVVVGDVLGCAVSDGDGLTPEKVRAAAESVLPPQHIPKVIRCLETMPVSPFGKVDYRAVAKLLE